MGKAFFIRIFSVFFFFAPFACDVVFAAERDCENGYYKEAGYCKPCPPGFNGSDANATDATGCFYKKQQQPGGSFTVTLITKNPGSCPEGQYWHNASSVCQKCPAGYFCPGVTIREYAQQGIYKCPKEHSESAAGSKKLTECYYTGWLGGKHYYSGCNSGYWYRPPSGNIDDQCVSCGADYPYTDTKTAVAEDSTTGQSYCMTSRLGTYQYEYRCDAGKYRKAGTKIGCAPCENGFVCPQDGYGYRYSKTMNQGLFKCPKGKKPSDDKKTCVDDTPPNPNNGGGSDLDSHDCKSGSAWAGQGQYYENNTCKDCPNPYKASDENATNQSQCFRQSAGGGKLYYKQTTCQKGYYLPALRNDCELCPKDNESYCPDQKTYWPSDNPQGIKKCTGDQVPNSNRSACENPSGDGGNIAGTETCEAGQYLPANKGRCEQCVYQRKYCPGGKYQYYKSTDQGAYDCPMYGVANDNHSACTLKLSQTDMRYGPGGAKTRLVDQCWTKDSTLLYARCLFLGSDMNQ